MPLRSRSRSERGSAEAVGGGAAVVAEDGWRQVDDVDRIAISQNDCSFDGVAQLAYVTGPVVGSQRFERGGRKARDASGHLPLESAEEVTTELGNVLSPVAQWRDPRCG